MKRVIKAASISGRTIVPDDLKEWYYWATLNDARLAGYDTDYIEDPDIIDFYRSEGFDYMGFILAKPEYADMLDDSGIGILDVIDNSGMLLAVEVAGGRIYPVDPGQVKRALGIE